MDGVQEVKITVAGEEIPAQLVQKSNRVYSVFVPLAAAQMNDQIIISVDGYAIDQAYGDWTVDAQQGTQSKLCTACQAVGEVLYGTTDKYAQVKAPQIGSTYYLAANVEGKLLSFLSNGGYTETSPYSLKTAEVLSEVTLIAALQEGQGEFQLKDATGKLIYSITDGAGATTSVNYVNDPAKVSFLMDSQGNKAIP